MPNPDMSTTRTHHIIVLYFQREEPQSPKSPVTIGGIEFAGSAKEAREKMAKRSSRKHEVKTVQGQSMRDKYELFQKL